MTRDLEEEEEEEEEEEGEETILELVIARELEQVSVCLTRKAVCSFLVRMYHDTHTHQHTHTHMHTRMFVQ
jgi:hypothetical protein